MTRHDATRNFRSRGILAATLASALAAGCSFIQPLPGAEAVTVASESQVADCKSLGTVTSSVLHKVLGFKRGAKAVMEDLVKVASNTAVELGGNTLVPLGEVENGRRRFGVYRCPR